MRLAAFLYAYPPDRLAGADLMSRDLLHTLAAAGIEVHVFTTVNKPPRDDGPIRVQARHQFVARGWDAIYAHPDLGPVPPQTARRLRVPFIAVVHNTDPRTGRALSANPPDLTVWNAHATADALSGYLPRDAAQTICRSPLTVADHATTPGDAVTLVNLSRAKGVDVLHTLARALPDIPFLGVRGGWGVQQDRLARPPNLHLTGPVAHPMLSVWQRTRVLLMPSEAESWGRVGVEAMCSGIPVIAHPTPGLREALGGAGVFVDRDDTRAWVAVVEEVWRAGPSEAARARARQVEADTREDVGAFVAAVADIVKAPPQGRRTA